MQLADICGTNKENIRLPVTITNVQTLLAWLRKRGPGWAEGFDDNRVQVTVNKHFAESLTLIEAEDEVAIIPTER
jgi:molybdopterin synthase sulfur carrier subunit